MDARLPDDILREVFLRCLPSECSQTTIAPNQPPVVLTHVSRRWRQIAVDLVALWRWATVPLEEPRLSFLALEVLADILERPKSTPLNLQLLCKTQNRGFDDDDIPQRLPHPVAHLLLPIAHTLTRLTISHIPTNDLVTIPQGSFPLLERLVLRLADDMYDIHPKDRKLVLAFQDAPSLRHVALGQWIMIGETVNVPIPRPQLTHVVIGYRADTDQECYPFVSHCLRVLTSLRCLYIHLDFFGDVGLLTPWKWDDVPVTRMDTVETLILDYGLWDFGFPDFINKFEFPNLTSLRLDALDFDLEGEGWGAGLTESFLTKIESFTRLERLSLSTARIPQSSLVRLFAAMPTLKTLELAVVCGYDEVFSVLTVGSSQGDEEGMHLLPQLHTLIIEVGQWISMKVDPVPFYQFLASRTSPQLDRRLAKMRWCSHHNGNSRWEDEELPTIPEGLAFERIHYDIDSKGRSWMTRERLMEDWLEVAVAIDE